MGKQCMLGFPWWQAGRLGIQVAEPRASRPRSVRVSGCGSLSPVQLQVENPSLAEQPGRPFCQSPKCAAETLALHDGAGAVFPRPVPLSRGLRWDCDQPPPCISAVTWRPAGSQQLSGSRSAAIVAWPGGSTEGAEAREPASAGSAIPSPGKFSLPCPPLPVPSTHRARGQAMCVSAGGRLFGLWPRSQPLGSR